MSVKSDAETISDLCSKIIEFEILRIQLTQSGGSIQVVQGNPDTSVPLTQAQRQTLLAAEDGWKSQIKAIAAAW